MFEPDKMYEYRNMIIDKLNVTKITKDNLHLLKEEDIMFIEDSNEGTHYIMDKDANLYGDISWVDCNNEDIQNQLPEYKKISGKNQKSYKGINLGMGHALIIKSSIYDEFMDLLKANIRYENEFEDCYNAYCHWMDNAEMFLK